MRYKISSFSRGFVVGAILFGTGLAQTASAQPSAAKREAESLACHERAMRIHENAEEALKVYLSRLAAQPFNAAWQPATCEALKRSIAASQKRIDWQGKGSRICFERFNTPEMQAIRADLRDSNDKKRALYRENCR